jgi:tetratricopeptide (TPR) repeat protein
VTTGVQLSARSVPGSVVLCIDQAADTTSRHSFIERIEPILPHLNWRSHFFILSEGPPGELGFTQQIIHALARYLVDNPLVTFYVHPLIRIESTERSEAARWDRVLEWMRPFQQQAYDQQSEARLLILPIIEPATDTPDAHWVQAARFFRAGFAKPSVLLRGSAAAARPREAPGEEIRFYIEPDERSGVDGLVRQLWMSHIFENVLERVRATAEGEDLLSPCPVHRVIDQRNGRVYLCFREWEAGRDFDTLERISGSAGRIAPDFRPGGCAGCISRSVCSMGQNLDANGSRAEGREVHFQLALAFSGRGLHYRASEHASRACDLAATDAHRADALIVRGLCHLGLRELEEAEGVLEEAARCSSDPGLVAFHRGRVQFEWRDYIEALDRFEEALASGSGAVSPVDLSYYMAVSHVHLQEYSQARSVLDRWERTGQRPALRLYYTGLCEIGEGDFGSALSELQAAERAGPAPEDIGNVLFYTGFCLKEMGRYEEAIRVLGRAVELDADESELFNLLGFCFYKTARHAEAVDCFRRAVELDPRSAIDHANLARNLKELGRNEEAIASYRRALALDPEIGFAGDDLLSLTEEAG